MLKEGAISLSLSVGPVEPETLEGASEDKHEKGDVQAEIEARRVFVGVIQGGNKRKTTIKI